MATRPLHNSVDWCIHTQPWHRLGPAIFKQKRVGARRRTDGQRETWTVCTFTLHKFRTILRRTIGRFLEDDVRNIEGLLGRRLDMWRQGYAG